MLVPAGIWLHAEVREGKRIRDRLDEQTKLTAEYQHQRDLEVTAHTVTKDQLEQERNLRAIAETQRNNAMRRVRELLVKYMGEATNEEIADATALLFSPIGGVVREEVPAANRPSAGSDDLEKP